MINQFGTGTFFSFLPLRRLHYICTHWGGTFSSALGSYFFSAPLLAHQHSFTVLTSFCCLCFLATNVPKVHLYLFTRWGQILILIWDNSTCWFKSSHFGFMLALPRQEPGHEPFITKLKCKHPLHVYESHLAEKHFCVIYVNCSR